ncbi:MAG: hypothetical protein NTU89_02075 [Candidatus Dependentiae bacterium]|nr:hypothetical protein [Candidatus Dependentiae bacterium]
MSLNTLYFKGSFFKAHFILIMLLLPLKMVASYSNEIIDVKVIHGAKRDTIILTFEKPNPIVTYAPASFIESTDGTVLRYFMPNTTIAENLDGETPASIEQGDLGVELVLNGRLIRKKLLLSPNKIFIQTERI